MYPKTKLKAGINFLKNQFARLGASARTGDIVVSLYALLITNVKTSMECIEKDNECIQRDNKFHTETSRKKVSMNGMKVMSMMVMCCVVSACASPPPRTLQLGEAELETWGETPVLFHSALYYPSEMSLNFPGYIIGIEKSPKQEISQEGDVNTVVIPNAGEKIGEHIARIGEDDKLLYISHILENFGDLHGLEACVHYNAYYRKDDAQTYIPFCRPEEVQQIDPKKAYVGSWDALDRLKQDIHEKMQKHSYTHIVVGMMGWNTDQEEAVRNFNSVAKNVKLAAGKEAFRPLFIGLTWPSKWAADWMTPIVT